MHTSTCMSPTNFKPLLHCMQNVCRVETFSLSLSNLYASLHPYATIGKVAQRKPWREMYFIEKKNNSNILCPSHTSHLELYCDCSTVLSQLSYMSCNKACKWSVAVLTTWISAPEVRQKFLSSECECATSTVNSFIIPSCEFWTSFCACAGWHHLHSPCTFSTTGLRDDCVIAILIDLTVVYKGSSFLASISYLQCKCCESTC